MVAIMMVAILKCAHLRVVCYDFLVMVEEVLYLIEGVLINNF